MLDITVHLGEGQTITALAFTTDQGPYVITTGGEQGRAEREVPIRVATGTRSAHRHELLRLLTPTITLPQAFPIAAEAWTIVGDEQRRPSLILRMHVFFEQLGGAAMLPAHHMQARLDFDTRHFPWDFEPVRMLVPPASQTTATPVAFGVHARHDGVMVTGSGALWLGGSTTIDQEWLNLLSQVPAARARCSFAVAGTNRRLELGATLHRVTPASAYGNTRWEFSELVEDPWADGTCETE